MIEGLEGVVNIIDDLLVWGDTIEEHDQRLIKVLERAREYNLKLNRNKCKIRTTEIKYIGHVLSTDGLKADDEKVRAVVQLPPPQDKQELMRFMGMIQYLAKFIPNLSEVSAPLLTVEEVVSRMPKAKYFSWLIKGFGKLNWTKKVPSCAHSTLL